mgnify:CR=1 FL=1
MSKECVEQVEGAGASVPMTDISNIDVPEGTDELSRNTRRAWRDRLNSASTRKMITGVLATLVGGSFWGFSGTSASFLFDTYHVDTLWLMSIRQILAGLLFMAVVVTRDRERLIKLWTTPADRKQLLLFTAFGLLFNQFCYLFGRAPDERRNRDGAPVPAARYHHGLRLRDRSPYAAYSRSHRHWPGSGWNLFNRHRRRPHQPEYLAAWLAAGLMCAVSAACMAVIPAKILPEYGSPIVTGSAMLTAGVVSCVFVQPWAHMPALDAAGIEALAVFVVIGSFFAYMLYMQGVKDIGSVRASLLGTMEPVSATITSALMLGTVFLPTDLAGFAMIIAMVFLTV